MKKGGGAAALLLDRKNRNSDKEQTEIETGSKLGQTVTSSYECEIIALNIGLDIAIEQEYQERHIHIMTDSLSWMKQLQSLPTRPRRVNNIVAECADKLAQLAQRNRVDIHFIPSHTDKSGNADGADTTHGTRTKSIGHSEEIDQLAKQAAKNGDETEHDPFLSSFKLHRKRKEKENLTEYIKGTVKTSKFAGYPERGRFIKPPIRTVETEEKPQPLLNRARTGHSCARQHLKNIMMEESSLCRHCNKYEETTEHQVLHCAALEEKLRSHIERVVMYKKKIHEATGKLI